ncbi:MAG: type 4a pilus biogenesis protein PilO [Clostridia bacterium]|jgi:Tfp pilus assembly protein PilO|nr:type 4a pilus biogenesis protein PilO [Clostridia bacterium]
MNFELKDLPKGILVTIGLLISMTVLIYYVHKQNLDNYSGVQNLLDAKKGAINTLNTSIDAKKIQLAELENFKRKYPMYDIEQARFDTLIYIKNFMTDLQLVEMTTEINIKEEHGIAEVPVEVKVAGNYEQLNDFIRKVQNRDKNIFVRDIKLNLISDNKLEGSLDVVALAKNTPNINTSIFLANVSSTSPFGIIVDFGRVRKELEDLQKDLITGKSEDIEELIKKGNSLKDTLDIAGIDTSSENVTQSMGAIIGFFPLREKSSEVKVLNSRVKTGINLSVKGETEIIAVESGTVIFADNLAGRGNTLMIKNDIGNVSIYSNLDVLHVKRGEKVNRHKVLGTAGKVNAFMNFGYTIGGINVDPKEHLNKNMMFN